MAAPTSLKLDDELKERLARVAAARRRTPHWMMREAVAEYVARQEDDLEGEADAEAAWEEFQRDRLGVPGDVMDEYLLALSRGERPPPPKLVRV